MANRDSFHLSKTAAQVYERQKVPAIFRPLAEATLDAIHLPRDAQVLDIACGTGIVAKLAADRLPGNGRVVGTDLNPAMVEIARNTMSATHHQTRWVVSDVTDMPFGSGEFDVAFCQQGLQFFPDRPAALREIHRVLAPEGRFILTVWSAISPLFQAVSDSLRPRVGEKAAGQALAPFSFRDDRVISKLLTDAGFEIAASRILTLERRLTPSRDKIREEILGAPYEPALREKGDETIDAVVTDIETALAAFSEGDCLCVPQESHLFEAVKECVD